MVDIIIPTIDDPKFLNHALKSIEDTCQIDKIHIYVINDNSKYDYKDVITSHSKLDIHYIISEVSIGPGPARNLGIKAGQGKWIAFLDCDDEYVDDVCKYCNDKYDYVLTNVIDFPNSVFLDDGKLRFAGGIHGLLVKRSFFEYHNLYFPNIRSSCEDTIYRTACIALTDNGLVIAKNSYYHYQLRIGSHFMGRTDGEKMIFDNDLMYVQQRDSYAWLTQLYLFLLKIKNINIDSKHWNTIIARTALDFMHKNGSENEFFIVTLVIKKFVNLKLINFKLFPLSEEQLFFFFIDQYVILDEDFIFFSPSKDYFYFVKKYYDILYPIIIKYFLTQFKIGYSISGLIALGEKYYNLQKIFIGG